jgi:hypothetical protein
VTRDIQYLIPDSGLLQQETKTTLSGLRSKLKIKEPTLKISKISYQPEEMMLQLKLELTAMVLLMILSLDKMQLEQQMVQQPPISPISKLLPR